ncbi:hypothetical protein [Pinibacter aurantiacus]|uniref:Porin family protein n=1 Tax=Pinibacter aurantiacus TaxID=2851599 RepID=A0A9E2S5Q9_9BACT|nr:hypothetical protein [Pinibacter aurantiacus]MBV4356261.1 hypothetical protein [Pinibacter aurantiacus]
MKSTIILLFCVLASVSFANAQNKAKFSSINQVGVLGNQSATTVAFQTLNGACYKGWFAGVGAGVDFHQYFTVPVFLDVRKEFGQTNYKPFVYLDGGVSIYADDKDAFYDYKNGGCFEGGVGYAFYFHKRQAVLLSAGYSYKSFKKERSWGDAWNHTVDTYNYNFNRLAVKVGLRF